MNRLHQLAFWIFAATVPASGVCGEPIANPDSRLGKRDLAGSRAPATLAQADLPKASRGIVPGIRKSADDPAPNSLSGAHADRRVWHHTEQFEIELWKLVRQKGNAEDYSAYLEMYPSGRFAAEAKRRLAALEGNFTRSSLPRGPRDAERLLDLSRSDRKHIQAGLKALGHDLGSIDGVFGPRTRSAIRRFQMQTNFKSSGYLTLDLAVALIGTGKRALRDRNRRPKATATSGVRTSNTDSALSAESATKRPIDRSKIEAAIIDFMIDVGSGNCWGNRYFCYVDGLEIIGITELNEIHLRVTSRYDLLSSNTLQATSEKKRFESDFMLLRESESFRVTSIFTDPKYLPAARPEEPDTASE